MKRIIALIVLAITLTASTNVKSEEQKELTTKGMVWICTGKSSECYHSNKSCKGLNSCKATKKEVTLEEAKRMGRRPCKICY